jgi:Glyoxalase/Bleomycin resistance protein/Dioxygenase superfamily
VARGGPYGRTAPGQGPHDPREPSFTETMQLGIVVRDFEAAMRTYVHDYGIGPWQVYEVNVENANDYREYGQPVERSWRQLSQAFGRAQRCCGLWMLRTFS